MCSVASLLNPLPPPDTMNNVPSPPTRPRGRLPSFSPQFPDSPCSSSAAVTSGLKKPKMSKDGAVFLKAKIKGEVNYPPQENFDAETLAELEKFHVYPVGKIREYPRHIPYNSEKKSFLEKTGRESFEVFQYTFKLPDDEKIYAVMWDYNIGLVRITPFFKCLKHTKTMPAKMLNLNPGLKEITHSITGGALVAQGYWLPLPCALALCTTFCAPIAGALTPLFGPSFPSLCVPPEAPEYGRMIIDPAIIAAATAQSEIYRRHYALAPHQFTPASSTPERLLRCLTDTDETSGASDTYMLSPEPFHTPLPLPHVPRSTNSWRFAIPRSTYPSRLSPPLVNVSPPMPAARLKRRLEMMGEADDEASVDSGEDGEDRKAAWLLVNLQMQDGAAKVVKKRRESY